MTNVFISLPMAGLMNNEIEERISLWTPQIEKDMKKFYDISEDDIKIISNFNPQYKLSSESLKHPNLEYLGEAIKKMSWCDYAYFIEGWTKARGCRIEYMVANKYNIPFIVVPDDDEIVRYVKSNTGSKVYTKEELNNDRR